MYRLLILIIILSCRNVNVDLPEEKYLYDNKELKVDYADLEIYNPFNLKNNLNTKYQIVSYLNVSCPPCINEIDQ